MKPFNLKVISFTEKGIRKKNEDRIYSSDFGSNGVLLLVADGMGGYEDGELASEIAIDVISKNIVEGDNVPEMIQLAFFKAHTAINKSLINSGVTVGGVIILESDVYAFWSGDVKIVLNNGGNIFISKEHSLLNLLKEASITIKPDEIKRLSHTVVRSLGGKSNSYLPEIIKLAKGSVCSGIICSDGLLQFYSNEDLSIKLLTANQIDIEEMFEFPSFENASDNVSGLVFSSMQMT